MLTKLTVRNFESLADVTVEFPRLAVLFGPNPGGKNNLLDAIAALSWVGNARTLSDVLDRPMHVRGHAAGRPTSSRRSPRNTSACGSLSGLYHLSSDRPISSSARCRTAHRPPTGSAAAGRVSYATRACRRRLPARSPRVRGSPAAAVA